MKNLGFALAHLVFQAPGVWNFAGFGTWEILRRDPQLNLWTSPEAVELKIGSGNIMEHLQDTSMVPSGKLT